MCGKPGHVITTCPVAWGGALYIAAEELAEQLRAAAVGLVLPPAKKRRRRARRRR